MTIPNLPTDNLYKFIALSGVFLLILALIYPEYKYSQIIEELEILEGEFSKIEVESDRIEDKRKALKRKIENLDEKCNCGQKSIVNDSIITRKIIIEGPPELIELSDEIQVLVDDYKELQIQQKLKLIEQKTKHRIISNKSEELAEFRKDENEYIGISFLTAVIGFIFWYDRTQKYQDKLLKFQYNKYVITEFCQSCGIYLKNNNWFNALTNEKQKEIKYCRECFENGQFKEPELTLSQMKNKVSDRCKEIGFSKLKRLIYLSRLSDLDRWRKKFKW